MIKFKSLKKVLKDFDESSEKFAEHNLKSAITECRKHLEEANKDIPSELAAESMAFSFMEDYRDKDTGWGTYYGPFAVFQKDGQWVESPSIQLITQETLIYWKKRAKEAVHPILKCRYADLVWEFSQPTISKKPSFEMARIVIDASIDIAKGDLHRFEGNTIRKLRRAMGLALSLNDNKRIISVRDSIIAYEDTICDDHKRGLWGFAYDTLLEENKKVPLTEDIENKIIEDLESRLTRVTDKPGSPEFNPFSAETAALRLASYYRRLDRSDDIKRVLLAYGKSFSEASKDAAGMVASAWLQRVHSVYLEFGMNKEAELIAAKLPELGQKTIDEMKSISHEVEIPKEKIDKYIAAMAEGELEFVLSRIAAKYIPSREETEDQLKEISKKYVFQSIVPKSICDKKGQTVAHIGNILEDLEGNVVHQMSQNIVFASFFLNQLLKELVTKFGLTAEKIGAELYKSPVYSENKRDIVEAGLKAYLEDDFLVSIHLLVPQIEDAFRNIVEEMGGPIYRRNRYGGFHLRTLDDLLRDERCIQALGEDALLYFRVLLTDTRGWNIRNSVCHGLPSIETFNPQVADRIVHALLVLAQLRIQET